MDISCIVPCLNEEKHIDSINRRLKDVFEKNGFSYEVIYVNDGSTDRTWEMLKSLQNRDNNVKAVSLNRNYGQHAAILAGLEISDGEYTVTIDADLQNPPEEIPKLLEKAKEGYDVVGGWRYPRNDPLVRKIFSKIMNFVISKSIGIRMHDYGCMLRIYKRNVVERIINNSENVTFIPALGVLFSENTAEVKIRHDAREKSHSRYNIFRLMKLNYDLITAFSLLPIQLLTFFGFFVAFTGFILSIYLVIRSFVIATSTGLEAIYMMFSVLYFFVGILLLSIGIIGEYVGRVYIQVRRRPKYIVKEYAGYEKKK